MRGAIGVGVGVGVGRTLCSSNHNHIFVGQMGSEATERAWVLRWVPDKAEGRGWQEHDGTIMHMHSLESLNRGRPSLHQGRSTKAP